MGDWELFAGTSDDACNRYFDLDSAACADGRDILATGWVPGPRERQLATLARLAEESELKLPLNTRGSALLAWHLAQRNPEGSLQSRRVRSASVFLSTQPQQGLPSLVPQALDRRNHKPMAQAATTRTTPAPAQSTFFEGMTRYAKRHCRWERSTDGSMMVPAFHQSNDQCAMQEESASCISNASAGMRRDTLEAPESPSSSDSHAWPSVLAGGASPFSMPKVCSLDGNSLFAINQRLQASRDSAPFPKTPPQQMPPPKPAVLSPPMLLCADSDRLSGIRIRRILASATQQQQQQQQLLHDSSSSLHEAKQAQSMAQVKVEDNVLDTGGSWDDEEGLVTVRYPYHDVWT